jgi:exodeoxyribonuclease VII small subunit
MTFEEALSRLEEVATELENSQTTLDEAIALYKEGVALSMHCAESLDAAEKEITVLQQSAEGIFTRTPLDAVGS